MTHAPPTTDDRRPDRLVILGRVLLAAGCLGLIAAPSFANSNQLQLGSQFLYLLVLAMMWNLLAGYADIVTLGQQAFVGVGAYAFYGFTVLARFDPFAALCITGLVSLAFAVPVMLVIFRLRAAYLSVGSWVVAEVVMLGAGKLTAFGGGSGISVPISVVKLFGSQPLARYVTIYWMALGLAASAFASTYLLMRSSIGLGLTAIRDDEQGAASVGVDVTRTRIVCFLWTAPFLGLAGALITLQKLRVAPAASFSIVDWTVYVIFIVVIGGIGSFEGPIVGTVVFLLFREYLSDLGVWQFIILGAVSICVILVEPRGIWGLLRRALSDDLIPITRKRRGPAGDVAAPGGSAGVGGIQAGRGGRLP